MRRSVLLQVVVHCPHFDRAVTATRNEAIDRLVACSDSHLCRDPAPVRRRAGARAPVPARLPGFSVAREVERRADPHPNPLPAPRGEGTGCGCAKLLFLPLPLAGEGRARASLASGSARRAALLLLGRRAPDRRRAAARRTSSPSPCPSASRRPRPSASRHPRPSASRWRRRRALALPFAPPPPFALPLAALSRSGAGLMSSGSGCVWTFSVGAEQAELDAAVLLLAVLGLVVGDRLVGSVADRSDAALVDARRDQEQLHRLRALPRQLHVEVALALVGRVAGDLDPQRRVLLEHLDRLLQQRERRRLDVGRVAPEVDALHDARELLDRRRDLVGAAVLVLVAVLGLGLVRALVRLVGDAVLVVVRIRAAVLVLELVLVLGLVGALVLLVDDAVVVLVLLGAAVALGRAGLRRGTCPCDRRCRRRRCPCPGSRRSPSGPPRSGTCPCRPGCRRCRCP